MGKKVVALLVLVVLAFQIISVTCSAETDPPPQLKSEAAILIDSNSGRVLYEKEADKRLYPASTTKIMSAILALENLNLNDTVVASQEAVESIPVGGSNIGILPGEQLTVEQLLYGMLVASANEACNVIAEYMSGSVDEFVVQMNQKAQELGMTNTKYLNTHGLHSPEHYTSARDLATLTRYAMRNEKFREMVATTRYVIPPTEKYPEERILTNTNYLISNLQNASYYYSKAIGVKTGYTSQAGNCLVSAASNTGTELIAVTLNAEPQPDAVYSFVDSKQLFEYGFANYQNQVVVEPETVITEAKVEEGQGVDFVRLVAKNELQALLPVDVNLEDVEQTVSLEERIAAPIAKGQVLGKISYKYDGYDLGEVELISDSEVKRDVFIYVMNRIFGFFAMPVVRIPLVILILLFAVLYIIRRINRRKRRKYLRSRRY